MQSGYAAAAAAAAGGGVSEIQQFMVDNCGAALFPISSANPAAASDMHSAAPHPLKYHPHHYHPSQPPGLPPHLAHFHSIPITQQLFHQPAAAGHQFQLFHPHQQYLPEPRRLVPLHQFALHQESAPENSASPTRIIHGGGGGGGGPSILSAAMSFKLAVNENSGGGGSRDAMNDDNGILQGDDGSESRLHHWRREDDSAIKELPWRPLDIDYINRNNERCNKDKQPDTSNPKYPKKSKGVAESDHDDVGGGTSSNYKIFSELEAIYKPGGSIVAATGQPSNNQTGSSSVLTGDEAPLLHGAHAAAVAAPVLLIGADRTSETSAGEEAPTAPNKSSSKSSELRRRKRKHRHVAAVTAFFESLVKQLMDHQEGLHRRFLELMEKREQERADLEEAWRKQEAANSARESAARARERALASSREAAIVAFIEKITGETLNLPPKPQFPSADADIPVEHNLQIETYDPDNQMNNNNKMELNTSRWPKAEVQALIRVRSGLETRFQETGLKGPLWEEVSAAMAAMGFHRSAKRCKEKWENINKYFRKTKEKGKRRPQHSKTCPYFQQLDQLYSKSLNSKRRANACVVEGQPMNDNSELLDAIVVPGDQQNLELVGEEEEEEEQHGHENDDSSLFLDRLQSLGDARSCIKLVDYLLYMN